MTKVSSYNFADTQSYVLNFHGRVTQASVKNFQVVHDNDGESGLHYKCSPVYMLPIHLLGDPLLSVDSIQ